MPTRLRQDRALIVFARAPEAGLVKTRLARGLGDAGALAAYRELGTVVLTAATAVPDCRTVVAFTPRDREGLVRAWLGEGPQYEPQVEGDLGARMLGAMAARFAAGAAEVLLIGTDCPALTPALLERGFASLDRADAVFGPASDGGYYLVGAARPIPQLFDDIPWSTGATLAVTLERAAAARLRVALLEERRDIDTAADWRAWRASRESALGPDAGRARPGHASSGG
jgi:rSAM/selenodomain-associated transferase 1